MRDSGCAGQVACRLLGYAVPEEVVVDLEVMDDLSQDFVGNLCNETWSIYKSAYIIYDWTLIFPVFRVVSPATACHDGDENTILVRGSKELSQELQSGLFTWRF